MLVLEYSQLWYNQFSALYMSNQPYAFCHNFDTAVTHTVTVCAQGQVQQFRNHPHF